MTEDEKRIRELAIRHAAIELRVPRSGDDTIDAMILDSLRLELAGQVVQGIWANSTFDWSDDDTAKHAFSQADALLAEWRKAHE